jgi:hypothetical protein
LKDELQIILAESKEGIVIDLHPSKLVGYSFDPGRTPNIS